MLQRCHWLDTRRGYTCSFLLFIFSRAPFTPLLQAVLQEHTTRGVVRIDWGLRAEPASAIRKQHLDYVSSDHNDAEHQRVSRSSRRLQQGKLLVGQS